MRILPTRYRGVLFRSRLEARYAVFLDALRIEWTYEPEAFILEDGSGYTPDFLLPFLAGGVYAEVKPLHGDFSRARSFCAETGFRIWLLEGEPRCVTTALLERVACPDCDAHQGEPCLPPEVDILEVVPLLGRAQQENRFFFSPGPPVGCDFMSWYGDQATHIAEASERARVHRFWEPARVSP